MSFLFLCNLFPIVFFFLNHLNLLLSSSIIKFSILSFDFLLKVEFILVLINNFHFGIIEIINNSNNPILFIAKFNNKMYLLLIFIMKNWFIDWYVDFIVFFLHILWSYCYFSYLICLFTYYLIIIIWLLWIWLD